MIIPSQLTPAVLCASWAHLAACCASWQQKCFEVCYPIWRWSVSRKLIVSRYVLCNIFDLFLSNKELHYDEILRDFRFTLYEAPNIVGWLTNSKGCEPMGWWEAQPGHRHGTDHEENNRVVWSMTIFRKNTLPPTSLKPSQIHGVISQKASISTVNVFRISSLFLPWSWRQAVPPKHWYTFTKLRDVTSQNIVRNQFPHCLYRDSNRTLPE
jgi:hypothetical protein